MGATHRHRENFAYSSFHSAFVSPSQKRKGAGGRPPAFRGARAHWDEAFPAAPHHAARMLVALLVGGVIAQSRRSTGRAPPVTFATDVCLAHPPECEGPDQFTARLLPRTFALRAGRRVEHHAGVSVMLVSKHGDTHAFDWSNLLHWSSAMLYSLCSPIAWSCAHAFAPPPPPAAAARI